MKTTISLNEQRLYALETLNSFRFWYFTNDYELTTAFYKKLVACYHLGFISRDCRRRAYHMREELKEQMLKKLAK